MMIFFNKLSWIVGMHKLKLGQHKTIFGQYKSNLGQYNMLIQQNQVQFLDSTWWFFQQNKLNFGYVQVEIGTVRDDFRTVQVEIGTVRDADSTNLGEILGQYKVISSSFTRWITNTLRWYPSLEQYKNELTTGAWKDNISCPINSSWVLLLMYSAP